jgi:hypothetical protein
MLAHFRRHWVITLVIYLPLTLCFIFMSWAFYMTAGPIWYGIKAEEIRKMRISIDDVDGSRYPVAPDQMQADATVEGVDVNHNIIRDEVERAIYTKYPVKKTQAAGGEDENLKLRAASLQLALSEQIFLNFVHDTQTMKAALEVSSAADSCLWHFAPELTDEERLTNAGIRDGFKRIDAIHKPREDFVKNNVQNSSERKKKIELVYQNYMTSYTLFNDGSGCNIIGL